MLSALEHHDELTLTHSASVATWSRRIAEKIGLPVQQAQFVERCALLHDVGKLLTPIRILAKPGPLSIDEWAVMKAHAVDGAKLLKDDPTLELYAEIVRAHHEHYDGRGYPDGLSGHEIPFEARIITVADSFDAMISRRPYRASLSPSTAIEQLQRFQGMQFDPIIVSCFVSIISERRLSPHNDAAAQTA